MSSEIAFSTSRNCVMIVAGMHGVQCYSRKGKQAMSKETRQEKLFRLEQELKELKATLPEHCYGTKGYTNVHHASAAHWQKIEDIEDEIEKLRAGLNC